VRAAPRARHDLPRWHLISRVLARAGFSHAVTFNLVPVLTGSVPLPPVRLLCVSSNTELLDSKARHLVFVRPAPQAAKA
jgi:hypothetical protein